MEKAVARLMALSEDEEARMIAESREKLRRDIAAAERMARKEGLERGLEKGLEKGREEALSVIARRMLRRGRPMEEIMEDTGLSQSEIMALQSDEQIRH
jgi:predicted transposase/invertase (TIGR01784 family)